MWDFKFWRSKIIFCLYGYVKVYSKHANPFTDEPGYNDIGLYDISPIASDILSYQLIPHC
jgi:hypothetical protein